MTPPRLEPAPAAEIDAVLVGFTHVLRAAGLPVTGDRTSAFLVAAAAVGAGSRAGVYWAGRATLCGEPDHIAVYDRAFEHWFAGRRARPGASSRHRPRVAGPAPLTDGPAAAGPGPQRTQTVRALASATEVLRHRDLAELSAADRAELAAMFVALRARLPMRSSARRRPARRGQVDGRATLRDQLRRAGEPGRVAHRRRSERPRRLVVLVDVSGSMSPYADALLRLGHVLARCDPRRVEVFTMGTRLTRVTPALRMRDPDAALRAAGEQVADWSGGTRLGEVLRAFADRWGQRGAARGAVVVVCSDGWERGDPALLAEQVARLRRLAHRLVWVNPHSGKDGYLPVQAGVAAVLPHVDDFLAGHSLATFEDLVEVIGRA